MLLELLYTSLVTSPIDVDSLDALLARARRRNAAEGVTGTLVYCNRSFVQLLEGERGVVEATFARVRRDCRHTRVRIVASGPISARSFPDWSMAFHRPRGGHLPDGWLRPGAATPETSAGARLFAALRTDLFEVCDFDRLAA